MMKKMKRVCCYLRPLRFVFCRESFACFYGRIYNRYRCVCVCTRVVLVKNKIGFSANLRSCFGFEFGQLVDPFFTKYFIELILKF